ncbi:hypothetical protein ABIA33_003021 [Streptacidiphilus sp. MAP12-16]|uniref:hypothetical protein n=1 Tax=Streptacidiphilus sp. MAP12-16 TaxID=3156300 RepID=UPI00351672E1
MSDTRSRDLPAPSAGLLVLPDAALGGYLADHSKVHLAAALTEDGPARRAAGHVLAARHHLAFCRTLS